MKTILRKGPLVIIERDNGEWWLTARKKRKKDGHGRKLINYSVRHHPIRRIPKKGDWLFTCKNYPVQFDHPLDDFPLENWFKYTDPKEKPFDDFVSIDGSHHSWTHCGLNLISDKYSEWYTKHKILDLFFDYNCGADWNKIERQVRGLCELSGIKYEGI